MSVADPPLNPGMKTSMARIKWRHETFLKFGLALKSRGSKPEQTDICTNIRHNQTALGNGMNSNGSVNSRI